MSIRTSWSLLQRTSEDNEENKDDKERPIIVVLYRMREKTVKSLMKRPVPDG